MQTTALAASAVRLLAQTCHLSTCADASVVSKVSFGLLLSLHGLIFHIHYATDMTDGQKLGTRLVFGWPANTFSSTAAAIMPSVTIHTRTIPCMGLQLQIYTECSDK